jgi:hypothetical protein
LKLAQAERLNTPISYADQTRPNAWHEPAYGCKVQLTEPADDTAAMFDSQVDG